MFCDELKIKVIAGNGGNGSISFRREKYIPKGGPDGGDGGKGGDIIFKVNPHLNTLSHLTAFKEYTAEKGQNGMGKNMYGKTGEDLILEVPPGTIIFNSDKSELIADLSQMGESVVVARGGKGGLGNSHFKSSTRQAPKFAEKGENGEEMDILLELKLVADVGIIGMPSAGKSTLLSVISNAKPKIAAYHFTTLIPNLGVVSMSKFGGGRNDSFVAADIPGLIEGASQGKGLGFQFLRHIARTKLLVHIIDAYLDNPGEQYKQIRKELSEFGSGLDKKDEIVVLNKIDTVDEKSLLKKEKELKKISKKKQIFRISGVTHEGLQPLLLEISKQLILIKKKTPKIRLKDSKITVLQPHLDKVKFELIKVEKKDDIKIFHMAGKRLEQLIQMSDLKNEEALERIYGYFDKTGIKKKLDKQNAQIGDIILIKGEEIPYRP